MAILIVKINEVPIHAEEFVANVKRSGILSSTDNEEGIVVEVEEIVIHPHSIVGIKCQDQ